MLLQYENLEFDSVFATEDELGIAALKYAKVKGVAVPEELSVVGYNNSNLSVCCEPELTSVDSMQDGLCRMTIEHMMGVVNGVDEIEKNLKIPCRIIKRCTTDF